MTFTTRTIRKSRGGVKLAAAASVLALVLAACGGAADDDGDTDAAETEAETEEEPEAEEEPDDDGEPDTDTDTGEEISVEMRIADGYPSVNPIVVGGADYFMERIVEEGAARGITVDIEYFGDQSLAGQAELLDTVGTGVADIGAVALSYFAEVVPAAGIAELPGLYDSPALGSPVFLQLIQEELMDDFIDGANVRPILVAALSPYNLFAVDNEILEPDDVAGLDIRSPGGVCDLAMEAVGANPIQMPVADQYIGLERGTLDGVVGPLANHRAYQIEEGTNYATNGLAMCGVSNMYMVNEDWFQSQPPEVQELILDIGLEASRNVGEFLETAEGEAIDYYRDYGMTVNDIEDRSAWDAALADVQDDWIALMDDQGIDGQALIDRWEELIAQEQG